MNITSSDRSPARWFQSLNADKGYGWALLASVGVMLVLQLGGEPVRVALRYEREGLAHYQLWRLVTGHLVHLGWRHALLNGIGLALLWVLFARDYSPRRWCWILGFAALSIDAGLWFLRPTIDWYVGASGVLHGALAAGALAMYRRAEWQGAVLFLGLAIKLVYEHQSGQSLLEQDLPLVPDAHVLGALGGLIGACWPRGNRL